MEPELFQLKIELDLWRYAVIIFFADPSVRLLIKMA